MFWMHYMAFSTSSQVSTLYLGRNSKNCCSLHRICTSNKMGWGIIHHFWSKCSLPFIKDLKFGCYDIFFCSSCMCFISGLQFQAHQGKAFDPDDHEHMQWVYTEVNAVELFITPLSQKWFPSVIWNAFASPIFESRKLALNISCGAICSFFFTLPCRLSREQSCLAFLE